VHESVLVDFVFEEYDTQGASVWHGAVMVRRRVGLTTKRVLHRAVLLLQLILVFILLSNC